MAVVNILNFIKNKVLVNIQRLGYSLNNVVNAKLRASAIPYRGTTILFGQNLTVFIFATI